MLPETLVNEVIKQICKSLASFDLKTRNKGFKRLQKVIGFCNTGTYKLELEHCLLIWKGLHYWLWSQDKLINQERLANDICKLLPAIKIRKTKFEFIASFLETQVREWKTLDKWRTDKFMMLLRRFFYQILKEIAENEWKEVDKLIDVLKQYLIIPDYVDPAFSLRLHFATIYLEELSKFELNDYLWMKLLTPYFDLIPQMAKDNTLFKRVEDMFFLVLPPAEDEEEPPLDINFGELGTYLYRLGGSGGRNTKKLYEWATICFTIAGISPPSDPPPMTTPEKPKQKRKRKLAAPPTKEIVIKENSFDSPPRKRRRTEDSSPSPSKAKRKKPTITEAKSHSPSTSPSKSKSPSSKQKSPTTLVPKQKSPTAAVPKQKSPTSLVPKVKSTPSKSPVTPVSKPRSPTATPNGSERNKRRVSFGKIYRKPFKKKDAVKTPSPGTITTSSAGKGILKNNLLLQSKKKFGLLFRR